jgi:hypothetical protein
MAAADGVDDFAVVDPLEIDRRDAEVRVAELALDDVQRDALAGRVGHRERIAHGQGRSDLRPVVR